MILEIQEICVAVPQKSKRGGLLSYFRVYFASVIASWELGIEPNLHVKWLTGPLVQKWPTFPQSETSVDPHLSR